MVNVIMIDSVFHTFLYHTNINFVKLKKRTNENSF